MCRRNEQVKTILSAASSQFVRIAPGDRLTALRIARQALKDAQALSPDSPFSKALTHPSFSDNDLESQNTSSAATAIRPQVAPAASASGSLSSAADSATAGSAEAPPRQHRDVTAEDPAARPSESSGQTDSSSEAGSSQGDEEVRTHTTDECHE
jgi:hypothetical protein